MNPAYTRYRICINLTAPAHSNSKAELMPIHISEHIADELFSLLEIAESEPELNELAQAIHHALRIAEMHSPV